MKETNWAHIAVALFLIALCALALEVGFQMKCGQSFWMRLISRMPID